MTIDLGRDRVAAAVRTAWAMILAPLAGVALFGALFFGLSLIQMALTGSPGPDPSFALGALAGFVGLAGSALACGAGDRDPLAAAAGGTAAGAVLGAFGGVLAAAWLGGGSGMELIAVGSLLAAGPISGFGIGGGGAAVGEALARRLEPEPARARVLVS